MLEKESDTFNSQPGVVLFLLVKYYFINSNFDVTFAVFLRLLIERYKIIRIFYWNKNELNIFVLKEIKKGGKNKIFNILIWFNLRKKYFYTFIKFNKKVSNQYIFVFLFK